MAGPALRKAKQYDWKESNLALFASDTEYQAKKESAMSEPAWKTAGQKVGLQIWRIVSFQVTEWPLSDYGKFYNGDSYIVLNTYKENGSEHLQYDVHFWIGVYSTQDEYGTAAYKTAELDTYLNDVPVQHREVQGHESQLFRSYFPTITILEGGAESGFRTVKPEEYQPRLLHFHGDRYGVKVKQVPRCRSRVDSDDVYILDLGLHLVQWNGKGSNKDERFKAMQYMKGIAEERGGKPKLDTVDEGFATHSEFKKYLDEEDGEEEEEEEEGGGGDGERVEEGAEVSTKQLFRLSDALGTLTFTLEKTDHVRHADFDSADVFILDTSAALFVWIGHQTTLRERKNAMTYAHNYLRKTNHPLIPVTVLPEGRKNADFETALAA
ncbi:gelsolin-like protein 2 [Babylonia areolata]|uniref:gelsolin-like protein 2 n=1 Tax=Babylonia areolata TaxID=304850 RepID=UPI003FD5D063